MATSTTHPKFKFKVKFTDNIKRNEFDLAKQLNHAATLNICDVHLGLDSAIVVLQSEDEMESLLTVEAQSKLHDLNLKIIPPGNYRSDRTVFVTKLRPFITNTDPLELLEKTKRGSKNSLLSYVIQRLKSQNLFENRM